MPHVVLGSAASRVFAGPLADFSGWQVRIRIAIHEAFRRIVRAVRSREGNFEKERLGTVVSVQKVDRGLSGPVRGMQALGECVWLGGIIVPSYPGGVWIQMRRLRPEPGPIVASKLRRLRAPGFIEQNAVISMLVALRLEVHLPDAHGVVAGVGQSLRVRER